MFLREFMKTSSALETAIMELALWVEQRGSTEVSENIKMGTDLFIAKNEQTNLSLIYCW